MSKFLRKSRLLEMVLATTMVFSLAGCGTSDKKAESDIPTLLWYQIGNKPKNLDELTNEANKIVEKEIGARIKIEYIGWGDYAQKMAVINSSGDSYDISYVDSKDYSKNAQKGVYLDITEKVKKYAPKSYETLDPAYIKGNLINGKLYALPINGNVYAQHMFTFNKQLVDKYNLDISKVNSFQSLEPLLKVIKENELAVTPIAANVNWKVRDNLDYPLGDSYPFAVDLKGDTTKIINQYDLPRYQELFKTMHKYYLAGYVAKDAATLTTPFKLQDKNWFVRRETQGPFDYGDTILKMAAQQELVSVPITEPLKSTEQAQVASLAISNNSKNPEKSLQFLELLNTNKDLLNLFVYGKKGTNWELEGDNKVKLLPAYAPDNHMAAWNTGNNLTVYPTTNITDTQIAERDRKIKEAKESPMLGFNVKIDNIKTELSNIANVMNQYDKGLHTGTLDPVKTLPELNQKLKVAGYEKVQKEIQSQYDEFLKSKK